MQRICNVAVPMVPRYASLELPALHDGLGGSHDTCDRQPVHLRGPQPGTDPHGRPGSDSEPHRGPDHAEPGNYAPAPNLGQRQAPAANPGCRHSAGRSVELPRRRLRVQEGSLYQIDDDTTARSRIKATTPRSTPTRRARSQGSIEPVPTT